MMACALAWREFFDPTPWNLCIRRCRLQRFSLYKSNKHSLTVRVHLDIKDSIFAFIANASACGFRFTQACVAVLAFEPRFTTQFTPHVNNPCCKYKQKFAHVKSINCRRYTLHKLQILPYVRSVNKLCSNLSIFVQFDDSSKAQVNQKIALIDRVRLKLLNSAKFHENGQIPRLCLKFHGPRKTGPWSWLTD